MHEALFPDFFLHIYKRHMKDARNPGEFKWWGPMKNAIGKGRVVVETNHLC